MSPPQSWVRLLRTALEQNRTADPHHSEDLANPKTNFNKTAGYTEAEITAFKNILDPPESSPDANKFVDVWRRLHPTDKQYTYFSYRFNCRLKGIGWRLDMCMFIPSHRTHFI
jgi:AP endonuclease-1